MAYSYVRYTGNGATTNYTFSFPTISTDHIKVRVNGTLVTNWSFLNSSTIQFAAAPANAAIIEIRRETPKDTAIVNFTDGSVLLERDLDLLATYQLYLAQETSDDLEGSILLTSSDTFDALNKRVVNVATPTSGGDAVNKTYADAVIAQADAAAAAQVSLATAQAGIATTQAGIATTQAGISTTKAAEAAASAASAASYAGAVVDNPFVVDNFTVPAGNGRVFTLSRSIASGNESAILVTVKGPTSSDSAYILTSDQYTVSGTTLTIKSSGSGGPGSAIYSSGDNVRVRYIGAMAVDASEVATNATSAASSATTATTAATSASTTATAFDKRYLGPKTSDPTLDNQGAALASGALYLNTPTGKLRYYTGSAWADSSNGVTNRFRFIATAAQTTFSGTDSNSKTLGYVAGFIDVYLNGSRLDQSDYTATNGTSIVLGVAASVNDELNIVAFDTFSVANTYTQAQVDTMVAGRLPVSGGALTGGLRSARVSMGANDIDISAGNVFTKTISGATTLTVSNVPSSGTVASFILDLTNGGVATVTWWSGTKWAGGTAPTLTAAGRDVLGFFTHDGGTTWTGLMLGKDVK